MNGQQNGGARLDWKILVLAAAMGGGASTAIVPALVPNIARPDPYTGTMAREDHQNMITLMRSETALQLRGLETTIRNHYDGARDLRKRVDKIEAWIQKEDPSWSIRHGVGMSPYTSSTHPRKGGSHASKQ